MTSSAIGRGSEKSTDVSSGETMSGREAISIFHWNSDIDLLKRMDASYWSEPSFLSEKRLRGVKGSTVSDHFKLIKEKWAPPNDEMVFVTDFHELDGATGLYAPLPRPPSEIKSARYLYERSDILVGRLRVNLRKITIAQERGVCSSEFRILRPNDKKVPPEILFLFLRSEHVLRILSKRSTGSTHPRVYESDILSLPIPVFPKRIVKDCVAEVQEGFACYRKGIGLLEDASSRLEAYLSQIETPQNVRVNSFVRWSNENDMVKRLDVAFWKKENGNHAGMMVIGDSCECYSGNTPLIYDFRKESNYRILKVRALKNRVLSYSTSKDNFVSEEFWRKNMDKRLRVGDILMGAAAHQPAYIGKKVDIVDETGGYDNLLVTGELMVIRCKDEAISPEVLLLFLRTRLCYDQIQQVVTGQTAHFYPQHMRQIMAPDILLNEKFNSAMELVRLVKAGIALIRRAERLIHSAQRRLDSTLGQMLQSIPNT